MPTIVKTAVIGTEDIRPECLDDFHALAVALGESDLQVDEKPYFEVDVEVTASYAPFVQGRMYMPNGDPGYPDEGGYCEELIIEVAIAKDDRADITSWIDERSLDRIIDWISDVSSEPDDGPTWEND